ncbi:hypothetical protein SESBI_08711 [Sesbania bispinosa]|nr:hypothetical protein SESBI_08711 [Sesbania bispinosa]
MAMNLTWKMGTQRRRAFSFLFSGGENHKPKRFTNSGFSFFPQHFIDLERRSLAPAAIEESLIRPLVEGVPPATRIDVIQLKNDHGTIFLVQIEDDLFLKPLTGIQDSLT